MLTIHHVASWILLATTTVFRCYANECTVPKGPVPAPHQVMAFATREACEEQRARLARVDLPVASSPSRPNLTIRQQITTYVCKEGA
jgi:hypothetical protein